ncbi:phosphotransferase [Acrocarpospora corrugata]|uniref:phosphotransferase n=1 Tax=Acrocarpospora corrugata TaxID=35763 RepID=UPI001C3F647C|nr:phosphotransferase [Acrocarpospora corrugata]
MADVEAVSARLTTVVGAPVVVLRLIDVTGGGWSRGGHVVYHAEVLHSANGGISVFGPVDAARRASLEPAAKRSGWATAAGVRAGLDWAMGETRAAGLTPTAVEQVKTWNLSGLFRIRVEGPDEAVWFKATPEFAACESTAIRLFGSADPELVPRLVAADPERRWVLLGHLPGRDCWDAPPEVIDHMVPRMVAAQLRLADAAAGLTDHTRPRLPGLADRTPPLQAGRTGGTPPRLAGLAGGTPPWPAALADRTPPRLAGLPTPLLDRMAGELTPDEIRAARTLVGRLPAMVAELAACGLPYTVTHGDFHPGNWRWDGRRAVAVDYADCHFGHPALDGLRLREFAPEERRAQVTDTWVRAWAEALPAADPARALTLAQPLAHLYYAIRYQEFMDGIEPSEQRYHAGDTAAELRAALESAA